MIDYWKSRTFSQKSTSSKAAHAVNHTKTTSLEYTFILVGFCGPTTLCFYITCWCRLSKRSVNSESLSVNSWGVFKHTNIYRNFFYYKNGPFPYIVKTSLQHSYLLFVSSSPRNLWGSTQLALWKLFPQLARATARLSSALDGACGVRLEPSGTWKWDFFLIVYGILSLYLRQRNYVFSKLTRFVWLVLHCCLIGVVMVECIVSRGYSEWTRHLACSENKSLQHTIYACVSACIHPLPQLSLRQGS